MRSSLARILLLSTAAVVLAGCTAGEVVDQNFHPYLPPTTLAMTFVSVDTNESYTYFPSTSAKTVFSFDPTAPTGIDPKTGIANVDVEIPAGDYYVQFMVVGLIGSEVVPGPRSPVFHHSYYTSCQDYFSKQSLQYCAPYYLQIFTQCSDWQCVNNSTDPNPPARTNGGYRVVPLLANEQGLPGPAPGIVSW
jgi:hypothetical protein